MRLSLNTQWGEAGRQTKTKASLGYIVSPAWSTEWDPDLENNKPTIYFTFECVNHISIFDFLSLKCIDFYFLYAAVLPAPMSVYHTYAVPTEASRGDRATEE